MDLPALEFDPAPRRGPHSRRLGRYQRKWRRELLGPLREIGFKLLRRSQLGLLLLLLKIGSCVPEGLCLGQAKRWLFVTNAAAVVGLVV